MRHFLLITTILVCISIKSLGQQNTSLTFYFNKGTSKLNQSQVEYLDKILDSLNLSDACKFNITGYTDNEGNKKKNLILSKDRAKSVADYLVSRGYDSAQITAKGIGQIGDSLAVLSEFEKGMNRKVVVEYTCHMTTTKDSIQKKTLNGFENDTIIYGQKGTQVRIKAEAFYPRKIKDVKIILTEIFSLCDSIPDDVETVTETGICLASGGMVFVQAEYKKKPIKSSRRAMFEVRIPVNNNDTTNNFYVAVRQKDGSLRWKERKGDIITENGKKYYVFETNVLGGFNCDAPIPGCNINSDQYYTLKTWTRSSRVRFYINDQFSFFTARRISKRKYAIPSTVSPDQIYIASSGYKEFYFPQFLLNIIPFYNNITYDHFITNNVFKLSELKYKSTRKLYKLRRRDFRIGYWNQLRNSFRQTMKCN